MGALGRAALALLILAGAALPTDGGEPLTVDAKARAVRVAAIAAKQGTYEVLKGAIEYALVSSGGKEYEALFTTACAPLAIHEALLKVGLRPGSPATPDEPPRGPAVRILVEYQAAGKTVRRPVDDFVIYARDGRRLEAAPWVFTGSTQAFDPASGKNVLQAALTKNIVGLHYTDGSALLQNPRAEARTENLYRANVKDLPKAGTRVVMVFERVTRKVPPGTRRVHLFVSGRVQGVGFRAFTQREARRLKLTGFVRNLADGRVEAVVEGPQKSVAALLAKLQRGPRAARVEKLDATDEPPAGDFESFEVRY